MNPTVQQGLNTLIKTQRDQIIRMSQSLSFTRDVAGANERSPPRIEAGGLGPELGHDGERVGAFDQSLSSKSKLIRVPNNQFTNKLKEKAENFELQRIKHASPNRVSSDYNASGFDHPQTSPRNQHGTTSAGLYQTWMQGPESASANDRGQRSSAPTRGPAAFNPNNPMQASLAGSSHL